ncbi:hypothetical protein [Methanosarcina vacuolata]|nr:hypothetical protein [Methanosarcina vacuolata]
MDICGKSDLEKLEAFLYDKELSALISCSFYHHESSKEHDDMQFA